MMSPKRGIINFFRGVMTTLLFLIIYNSVIASNPYFSKISAWGSAWGGLFMSGLVVWIILESFNWYFKNTRIGHLPALFWALATGINGADFSASVFSLFEITNFDKIMHFSLSGVGAVIFIVLVKRVIQAYEIKIAVSWAYYAAVASVNFLNVLYEIGEMLGDKYFGAHNITGPFDTAGDFIANNLGILLVILLDLIITKTKRASG